MQLKEDEDLQINGNDSFWAYRANKIFKAVESEMCRVASMEGTRHDDAPTSDKVEFEGLNRTAAGRLFHQVIYGSANNGGWSASAQFKEPHSDQMVSMDSTIQNHPHSPTKTQKMSYRETDQQQTYTVYTRFVKVGDGPGDIDTRAHGVTLIVDKATGSILMQDHDGEVAPGVMGRTPHQR